MRPHTPSTTTTARSSPSPTLLNIGSLAKQSAHSIWRHKDSSEKTPSTVASDDEAYICPAVPVFASSTMPATGSSRRPGPEMAAVGGRHGRWKPSTSVRRNDGARAARAAVGKPRNEGGTGPAEDNALPEDQTERTASPVSSAGAPVRSRTPTSPTGSRDRPRPISRRPRPPFGVLRRPPHLRYAPTPPPSPAPLTTTPTPGTPLTSLSSLPPFTPLTPLKPVYRPPLRRPTPPGVPPYETSQRTLEARLALRHAELQRAEQFGVLGGAAAATTTRAAGSGANASSFGLWRRRTALPRQHGRGVGGGGNTTTHHPPQGHGVPLVPIWRPPVSQHTIGEHPLLRGLRQSERAPRQERDLVASTAAAAADLEARAGRAARPVTLDDYLFLQDLHRLDDAATTGLTGGTGGGGGGHGRGGGAGACSRQTDEVHAEEATAFSCVQLCWRAWLSPRALRRTRSPEVDVS
ncbi:hypothetical protein SPI_05880 [Niveomyces insectorum RCEF 264]|uniref:Uncharacterized protein n=1 Tax=Niveomyces insectorum RCEF 264 TaxID=1081102 RepID=A0A167SJM5_9HYPO|nr:hypothetical protein SPI_05880 [Niveomyces insectorum RCEF 264]